MRLRFRYSLKVFLLLWLLVGLGLGWFGIRWQRARKQAAAVKAIVHGSVNYDYEDEYIYESRSGQLVDGEELRFVNWNHQWPTDAYSRPLTAAYLSGPVPSEPAWLLNTLGVDYFHPITSYTYPRRRCGVHLFLTPQLTVGLAKELDQLAAFPHLRMVYIWADKIDVPQIMRSGPFTQLGKLSELEELVLYGLPVTAEQLAPLRDHPKLRKLVLTEARISDEALLALGTLPALEELDLSRCPTIGKQGLTAIRQWKNLRTVELAETGCDYQVIESLRELPQLEAVNLAVTSVRPRALQEMRTFPRLKRICLAHTYLTDAELAEAFAGWSSLETLDLTATSAARQFADQVPTLTGLKYLKLWNTPISEDYDLNNRVSDSLVDCQFETAGSPFGGPSHSFELYLQSLEADQKAAEEQDSEGNDAESAAAKTESSREPQDSASASGAGVF